MLVLLAVYSSLIVGASMLGGWLPSRLRLTHVRLQFTISLVGGLMLGTALFQMLPHAIRDLGADRAEQVGGALLAGMATMFALLRMFHFHHHDTTGVDEGALEEAHHHDHDHDCDSHGPRLPARRLTWLGVFVGLAVHTLLDGIALAASIDASRDHSPTPGWRLAGVGAFLAILLHKPLDAISISSLMTAGGWSARARAVVNLAFSLMCPAGAMLYLAGGARLNVDGATLAGLTLAFSSGVFLCIALSDLLPEIEFHSHHRSGLTAALATGLVLAWGVSRLEPQHGPAPGQMSAFGAGQR